MSSVSSFFFSSRRRHTRCSRDWSSDVCSSDLFGPTTRLLPSLEPRVRVIPMTTERTPPSREHTFLLQPTSSGETNLTRDRKSTRLNSSHGYISYAVFCLNKKSKSQM